MRNITLPQVRLPYRTVKGSLQQRQDKSAQLVHKFYREIKGRFRHGEISLKEIQKCVDENLPPNINVIVKNLVQEAEDADLLGYSVLNYNSSSKINSISLELLTAENKIPLRDLPSLMHEFTHITDQLYNPKILARCQNMTEKDLYIKDYDNLYENFIYNLEEPESKKEKEYILKRLEQVIKEFLKKIPNLQDKVSYLQDSRYSTMLEINGYHSQRKFAKNLAKQHVNVDDVDLMNENKNYMFSEKLELLNKLLKEIITKERIKHRAKINRESKKKLKFSKEIQPQ